MQAKQQKIDKNENYHYSIITPFKLDWLKEEAYSETIRTKRHSVQIITIITSINLPIFFSRFYQLLQEINSIFRNLAR